MNKTSLLIKSFSFCLVVMMFTSSIGFSKDPSVFIAARNCGEWEIGSINSDSTQGIGVTLLQQADGSDCSGMFILENQTGSLSGDGYSLALEKDPNNANIQFLPSGDSILVPGLNMVIKVTPNDIIKLENVELKGVITPGSFLGVDLSTFFLKSLMDLFPLPAGCSIPNDQILLIALNASPALEDTASMVFKGDLLGSRDELSRAINGFYENAVNASLEIGNGCFADFLKSSSTKPGVKAKIILSYTTWLPVFIFDYFKVQGMDVTVDLSYVPRVQPTSVPSSTRSPMPTLTINSFPTPTFTVEPNAAPPTLVSPQDRSSWPQSTDITLVWEPSFNGAEYQVVVWGDAMNTLTACTWQAETSCNVGQMTSGKKYWHVQARNGSGVKTDWSETWSFNILGN